jgi:hypothetical protein
MPWSVSILRPGLGLLTIGVSSTTTADLAQAKTSRYWRLVRERAGRRMYYDAVQVARIVKQVARLRRAGTLA